jgi:hypothetical protein
MKAFHSQWTTPTVKEWETTIEATATTGWGLSY